MFLSDFYISNYSKFYRFFITNGQKVRLGEPLGCINDLDEISTDEKNKLKQE